MDFKTFERIINKFEEQSNKVQLLYNNGIDLMEFNDNFYAIINDLFIESFGSLANDWISWYMFEKDFGKKNDFKAWNKNKNEIAYDLKSLYHLVLSCNKE